MNDVSIDYEPTAEDMRFVRSMIRVMNHNGIWEVPKNNTKYRIDQNLKTFTLIQGNLDGVFYITKKCLERLGWTACIDVGQPLDTGSGKSSTFTLSA